MSSACLEELIADWIDGRIDEARSKRLQQELLTSPAARKLFRKHANLDALLHEVASTGVMPAASILSCPNDREGDLRIADRVDPAAHGLASQRWAIVNRGAWIATCAAALMLSLSLRESNVATTPETSVVRLSDELDGLGAEPADRLQKPPAPIATLSMAEGADWETPSREVGDPFYEGETIKLVGGKARVSVGFGAEIIAEAPLSLTFISSDRLELHHGEVAIDVAPWAKGFTVVTADMDVVDLGTTFTVSASPGKRSEASVLRGLVRVHASGAAQGRRQGMLIAEGEQVSIKGGGITRGLQPRDVRLLLRDLDFGDAQPYRPVALHNTGHRLSAGDQDINWRILRGPEGEINHPQFATVCVPHESYLANDAAASQWVSIADWTSAKANATYTFRTEFSLSQYDLSTMQLFGRLLADNGVLAVRVNGEPVHVQSWVDNTRYQPFGVSQFRFVNVTKGLVQGDNAIEIDVRNGMQRTWNEEKSAAQLSAIPNPMALRVEWCAYGRHFSSTQALRQAAHREPAELERFEASQDAISVHHLLTPTASILLN